MDKEALTKKYLGTGGSRCPFCGTHNIEGGERDVQDYVVYQNIVCLDCKKEWTDEYTLTGVEFSEDTIGETVGEVLTLRSAPERWDIYARHSIVMAHLQMLVDEDIISLEDFDVYLREQAVIDNSKEKVEGE